MVHASEVKNIYALHCSQAFPYLFSSRENGKGEPLSALLLFVWAQCLDKA